jgi:surfeit locus 1 family protein
VLRTALRPRFLGLLGLVLVVGAAFVWLGRWQLGVAESTAHVEAVGRARAEVPAALTTVLQPHAAFREGLSSRPVTATGRYAAEGQLVVPGRRLDGHTGAWVLTPFVVDGSGATLPVLRGFVTDPADAGAPPSGTLTVAGGLAPGESPATTALPPGQLGSVDPSVLVNTWPGDLYNAFLFLQSESPASGPQLAKVPTPVGDTGIRWRNAAYAVQWWVFAAFALWLWVRMVREEAARGTAAGPVTGAPDRPLAATGDNGRRDDA